MNVDIIMPIYNPNKWIFQAIESVFSQTYNSYNLYIIDDCSPLPSKTLSKIVQMSKNEENITYKRLESNKKAANARNVGVSISSGDFIAFLDQDDFWHPDKLSESVAYLNDNPSIGMVHSNILGVSSLGEIDKEIFLEENNFRNQKYYHLMDTLEVSKEIFTTYSVRLGTMVVQRKAFEKIGGFDAKLFGGEDLDFAVRLASKFRVGHFPKSLSFRRFHTSSVSKSFKRKRNIGRLNAIVKLHSKFPHLSSVSSNKFKTQLQDTIKMDLGSGKNKSALKLSYLLFKIEPKEFKTFSFLFLSLLNINGLFFFNFYRKFKESLEI